MLSVANKFFMLNVVKLNVIMLSVVAPLPTLLVPADRKKVFD
jgi:hypothetical protein